MDSMNLRALFKLADSKQNHSHGSLIASLIVLLEVVLYMSLKMWRYKLVKIIMNRRKLQPIFPIVPATQSTLRVP
jgi:uncharacterized membrane protein YidH (DUF202 family)